MPLKIVKIAIYGLSKQVKLSITSLTHEKLWLKPDHEIEYRDLESICFDSDDNFRHILRSWEPDLIVVIGNIDSFPNIKSLQPTLQSKLYLLSLEEWKSESINYWSELFFDRYVKNSITNNYSDDKISVYSATCNTKERLWVAYDSLKTQTHQNWEWSIYDDSSDNYTWEVVKEIAKSDCRVVINKNYNQSLYSRIGFNKFNAATNCSSNYIVELDHDDGLTKDALEKILLTHKKFPECGFVYGDWIEMNRDTFQEFHYGDGFAWGYGHNYETKHPFLDRQMPVIRAPNINPITIRRLWSMYNHPKSWKKDVYMKIGGHNRYLNCADDYELMIRTFLNTRMVHLNHFCYIQYIYNNNTKVSNGGLGWKYHGDIFRHVRYIQNQYQEQIKNRFEELGRVDWIYKPNQTDCLRDVYFGRTQPLRGSEENNVNLEFKP